ncbi:porphobilinogen deaminase [Dimargaris verticillata]|uniref:hydroxymethylbilane synthase n=1 Tax=Dimargaris verticillata TaxID=2761393 RepID=A0A9W8B683_9FUNG|nr:porphobilinogen deaminase [Dimargaris verticillata]
MTVSAPIARPNAQGNTEPNAARFPIGSRKSALALIQTHHVRDRLSQLFPKATFPLVTMSTQGDRILDVALAKIGEKALFTKELEVALEAQQVDLVVHSLKDLPTTLPPGMVIGAILEREDPRDAVVMKQGHPYHSLADLPAGSVVGTSSVRRIAQLRRRFPKLDFQDIRGNLNTRIKKLDDPQGPFDALILAVAGLQRLGWSNRITQAIPEHIMLHAVGQGALAVECREDDTVTSRLVAQLTHTDTLLRCVAERTVMRVLEGGCSVPLGVYTEFSGTGSKRTMRLHCLVASLDGQQIVEAELVRPMPPTADESLARELGLAVAEMMERRGARALLETIKRA